MVIEYKICVLASSSKGNSTFVRIGDKKFLIDIGISTRKIIKKLKEIGENISEITDILISHEHNDHIAGLKTFTKRYQPKCWLTFGTYKKIRKKIGPFDAEFIEVGEPFHLDNVEIVPYEIMHDAADPVAFLILDRHEPLIGYLNDCGYPNTVLLDSFRNIKILIIEANHSFDLLLNNSYSTQLKDRILSSGGHLSNWISAEFISLANPKVAILSHISENSNTPETVISEVNFVLEHKKDIEIPILVIVPPQQRSIIIQSKKK